MDEVSICSNFATFRCRDKPLSGMCKFSFSARTRYLLCLLFGPAESGVEEEDSEYLLLFFFFSLFVGTGSVSSSSNSLLATAVRRLLIRTVALHLVYCGLKRSTLHCSFWIGSFSGSICCRIAAIVSGLEEEVACARPIVNSSSLSVPVPASMSPFWLLVLQSAIIRLVRC